VQEIACLKDAFYEWPLKNGYLLFLYPRSFHKNATNIVYGHKINICDAYNNLEIYGLS
jgi:hypothetical protein